MATDKRQKFQQFSGDRCSAAVLNGPAQPPLAANATPSDRHIGVGVSKRNSSQHSSIVVQVAASTSNEQLHSNSNNNNDNNNNINNDHQLDDSETTTRREVAATDQNNNNNTYHHPTRNAMPQPPPPTSSPAINCHHQAATRTLLFHHHNHNHRLDDHSSLATSTTTTLDSSLAARTDTSSDEQSPTPPPNYHEIPGIVPAYQGRSSGPPPSYDDVVNPNAPPPSYQSLFGQVREARKTSNGLVDLLRQLFLILVGTLGCTMIIGFLLLIPITMILVGIVYVNECRAENIPTFLVIGGIVWIMKNILNCYNQFKKDSSIPNRPPPRRSPNSSRSSLSTASSSAGQLAAGNGDSPASVLIVGHHNQTLSADNNSTATATTTTSQIITPPPATTSSTTTIRTRREQEHSANRIRTPSLIGITSFKCESMLNYFLTVWFFAGCIVVYRIYEPDYDNPMSQSYCHRTVYLYAFWLITSAFIIMAIVLSCLCCLMASSLMNCNHGR